MDNFKNFNLELIRPFKAPKTIGCAILCKSEAEVGFLFTLFASFWTGFVGGLLALIPIFGGGPASAIFNIVVVRPTPRAAPPGGRETPRAAPRRAPPVDYALVGALSPDPALRAAAWAQSYLVTYIIFGVFTIAKEPKQMKYGVFGILVYLIVNIAVAYGTMELVVPPAIYCLKAVIVFQMMKYAYAIYKEGTSGAPLL